MSEALEKIINSTSKTFIAFCFCFILGVGIFSFLGSDRFLFYSYISLFLVLFFIIILWHKKLERFLLLCLFVFIFGGMRFLISIPNHDSSRIEYYNDSKVSLQGWVSAEPDIRISDARYTVSVLCKGDPCEKVSGKIIIKTLLYPQYQYGDKLEISCSLQEPENSADSNFNYQKYLAKQGVWSVCLNPKVTSLDENQGNFLFKTMLRLKSEAQSRMSRLWPEPDNSLMTGLLYGSRGGLPQELVDNFSRTGVSHIMAVSGYNVSILAVALNIILIYIGFFRRQSFWFLISLILAFVFFTGATASVVRAGVMAVIILASQYIGRLSAMGRVLVYAAVIMLALNPYLLIWDAGFQLSFLSTLGLVYLSPILQSALMKKVRVKNATLIILMEIFTVTIAAIMAATPLILFQFGRLSLVAPLVNILILWLVPWLMLFGFISLILSWLFFPLGQAVAWAAGLGLNYVIIIVDWFGNKSWSAVNLQLPFWIVILMYLALIVYVQKNKSSVI
ncbi:MAG: ComEC/Rec2 family competence protein [Patescibacteria group bacterium]